MNWRALKAEKEKSRVAGLREAAALAMQWNPNEAGLLENFQTWQHAMSLFAERLQRMANESTEPERKEG